MFTTPFDKARAAIASAQADKAEANAKPAIDAMKAVVAAVEAAKAQDLIKQAAAKAMAVAHWKKIENTMEEALEHAGISGIDAQIDENGFCRLFGQVASEDDNQTATAMAEQFAVTGLDSQLVVVPPPPQEMDATAEELAHIDQPVKYTVKAGESWWGIAQRVYSDGLLWKSLKAANNNPKMIHPGTEITLPPKANLSR